jgi:DNA-binding CsgD family transcriptional regulator
MKIKTREDFLPASESNSAREAIEVKLRAKDIRVLLDKLQEHFRKVQERFAFLSDTNFLSDPDFFALRLRWGKRLILVGKPLISELMRGQEFRNIWQSFRPREKDVLCVVLADPAGTYKAYGKILDISPETVKKHLQTIYNTAEVSGSDKKARFALIAKFHLLVPNLLIY